MAPDIQVWSVSLAGAGLDTTLLSDDERARARGLARLDVRRRFVTTRSWLRRILGNTLAVDPRALRFVVAVGGKPRLVHPAGDLEFNVSHAHDLAVIALGRGVPVGVDVEWVHRRIQVPRLARRMFRSDDAERLVALDEPERTARFLLSWTRHEAQAKATGRGIAMRPWGLTLAPDFSAGMWGQSFEPAADYVATICAPLPPRDVQFCVRALP